LFTPVAKLSMQYDEALRYLLSLGHETLAIKLGLKNTELLLDALGNPQRSYPAVQIAGTNGKGSTAVVLDSICRAAGIKTGLFTSPHLVSITERLKVGGDEITQADFARLATAVRGAAERLWDDRRLAALPTFFEHLTAIGLLAFKEEKIDIAILETGLGGRLDSTTVARAETVAITPIALDHQEYLGETLAQIAAEKAAIIRPGVTAIIAPQPLAALNVILQQSERCRVKPHLDDCTATVLRATDDGRLHVKFETEQYCYPDVLLGLRGRHQITNVSVALRLAESLRDRGFRISGAAITHGIEAANHPGRLELCAGPPRMLFDGAHNPAGARALRDYLDEFINAPVTLVFGAMRDKNLDEMAEILFPVANHLILTQPDNPRAATLETLGRVAARFQDADRITLARAAKGAIGAAREQTAAEGLICFTGSLYLLGEIRAALAQMPWAVQVEIKRPACATVGEL
jgi:dihydrofolate synthase/folylpolyglutamate synthase